MYRIEYEARARKELTALPRHVRRQVSEAIEHLSTDPRPPGCRKISGTEDGYRIRVGRYRVIYGVKEQVLVIVIVRVAKRDEATYRGL
ncbi:MAG TPA: type II toxin-antitoxin system RelE/ParE family toxin [Dehalococcoidia bacterium]|nr:type II toxin-antitoxin system RelE/ParE family toxin [Dehalococcoidia bacterium]